MLLNFLKQYVPDGENIPIHDFAKIFNNYWNKGFFMDVITILPLPFAFSFWEHYYLFYSVKILRFKNGLGLLDVTKVLDVIKQGHKRKVEELIKNNPTIADDKR